MTTKQTRPICEIAKEIQKLWTRPNYGAIPYINAMLALHDRTDKYGVESARTIINYFLSNAVTWRGEDAKRIKLELKEVANHE